MTQTFAEPKRVTPGGAIFTVQSVKPALTITAPAFPLTVETPTATYDLHVSWKATAGRFTSITKRARPSGVAQRTPWINLGTEPAAAGVVTFTLPLGMFDVAIQGDGPDGAAATGMTRTVAVTQKAVVVVDPPRETLTIETNDRTHKIGARDGGGREGETARYGPKGLATAEGTGGSDQELRLVRGEGGVFALRAPNGGVGSVQENGQFVFNRERPLEWKPEGWEALKAEPVEGGGVSIVSVAHGTRLAAADQGGGALKFIANEIGIDETFWPSVALASGGVRPGAGLRGRLRVDGRMLRAADGKYFRPVFASALTALAPGKPYARFFDWAAASGFNGVRIFAGALSWAGQTAASARAAMPAVLAAAAERGLYVELTLHTDTKTAPYDKVAHQREVLTIIRGMPHVIVELANEYEHPTQDGQVNDRNWLRQQVPMFRDAGFPVAIGAPPEDEPDPQGRWNGVGGTYGTAHLDRGRDKWNQCRRVREIENCSDMGGFPVLNNEPIGAAEPGTPGQRRNDPEFFFTLGALNRLFEVGGVFHFQDGLNCTLPVGPVQQQCADAFVRASHLMDAIEERLTFKNATWGDAPIAKANFDKTIVRAYSGVAGNRGCTALVGLSGNPGLQWANGWESTGVAGEMPGITILNIKN